MLFLIIGTVVVLVVITYGLYNKAKSNQDVNQDTLQVHSTPEAKSDQKKDNPYEGLRKMALSTTPEILQLSLPSDKTIVYGVVMDWEISGGTVTTVSYSTGAASMYLSNGGGVIGGEFHKNVNAAAKLFVDKAQAFLNKTQKTETTPLPGRNFVIFYLLTNKGIFKGQENMKNFENNSSPWIGLFDQGNKVISELHAINQ